MATMAGESCDAYRAVVREPDFVAYFRHATRNRSWASCPGLPPGATGWRGRNREPAGHPVDFRLVPEPAHPARLAGAGALRGALDRGQGICCARWPAIWPFFATRLAMLEMVFAKTDAGISAYYDEHAGSGRAAPVSAQRCASNWPVTSVRCWR